MRRDSTQLSSQLAKGVWPSSSGQCSYPDEVSRSCWGTVCAFVLVRVAFLTALSILLPRVRSSMIDYKSLIDLFWQADVQHGFTGNETKLWLYLVKMCGDMGSDFSIADGKAGAIIGISPNVFRAARQRLCDIGFLRFEIGGKGGRGDKTRYQILTPLTQKKGSKRVQNLNSLTPFFDPKRVQKMNPFEDDQKVSPTPPSKNKNISLSHEDACAQAENMKSGEPERPPPPEQPPDGWTPESLPVYKSFCALRNERPGEIWRRTIQGLLAPRGSTQGARAAGSRKLHNGYTPEQLIEALEDAALRGHRSPDAFIAHVTKQMQPAGGRNDTQQASTAGQQKPTADSRADGRTDYQRRREYSTQPLREQDYADFAASLPDVRPGD